MLTLYVRTSADRLEIGRGESRAQFELRDNHWAPVWIWHGDRRMLRFKNHEWLALGHVRPRASDWEIVEDTVERVLVRFWGQDSCFGVPVEWSVWVGAETRWPGFTITTEITPLQRIELFECFSRFETPAEYDGHEEMLCMIGQEAVSCWRGTECLTADALTAAIPPSLRGGPAYPSPPTRTPICCVRLIPSGQAPERHVTFLGHWDACSFRTICVAPTEFENDRRAYEFRVGTLDPQCWGGLEHRVFFEEGESYRQSISVACSSELPGGSLDRWFYGVFERSLRHYFPETGAQESERPGRAKKVTLAEANAWLLGVITGNGVPGLYSPDAGMVNSVEGSSANAGRFALASLAPWIGAIGYQSYVMRRDDLAEVCKRWIQPVAAAINEPQPASRTACPLFHEILPLLRYLRLFPNDTLQATVRRALEKMIESPSLERANESPTDFGPEVFRSEACLMAGQMSGDKRLLETGLAGLERINEAVRSQFWRFGCGGISEDETDTGQVRPLAYGHAILCNLTAYQHGHNERYMEMAGTFARYFVSLCCATFNDSADPNFDTRGFANAAIAGHDRRIECAPIETSDSLRCLAYWLGFRPDNPAGLYDLLWLLSRTFCGVFPAAREHHAGFGADGRPVSHRTEDLPTAIACQRFPFIAYEDPIRQTRLSPRASVEALLNYLTFGGGLASCDNERLLVLAPRAGGCDVAERVGRLVHIHNPGETEEEARLAIHHLSARRQFEIILGNKRIAAGVAGDALKDIAVQLAPRRTVVVEIVPTHQPSSF